jgi:hypothetical protein
MDPVLVDVRTAVVPALFAGGHPRGTGSCRKSAVLTSMKVAVPVMS